MLSVRNDFGFKDEVLIKTDLKQQEWISCHITRSWSRQLLVLVLHFEDLQASLLFSSHSLIVTRSLWPPSLHFCVEGTTNEEMSLAISILSVRKAEAFLEALSRQ